MQRAVDLSGPVSTELYFTGVHEPAKRVTVNFAVRDHRCCVLLASHPIIAALRVSPQ